MGGYEFREGYEFGGYDLEIKKDNAWALSLFSINFLI
jgi:hypothetical protein